MSPELQNLIEDFGRAPVRLREALTPIPRSFWKFKPSKSAWSIHEQIIHLADGETFGYQRIRKAIAEPQANVMAFDRDGWVIRLDYHHQSTDEAIELYTLLRKMSYHLLVNLTDDNLWQQTIIHPERGTQTLEQVVRLFAYHDHVAQIQRTYLLAQEAQN